MLGDPVLIVLVLRIVIFLTNYFQLMSELLQFSNVWIVAPHKRLQYIKPNKPS